MASTSRPPSPPPRLGQDGPGHAAGELDGTDGEKAPPPQLSGQDTSQIIGVRCGGRGLGRPTGRWPRGRFGAAVLVVVGGEGSRAEVDVDGRVTVVVDAAGQVVARYVGWHGRSVGWSVGFCLASGLARMICATGNASTVDLDTNVM